jgi:hypothetical protein
MQDLAARKSRWDDFLGDPRGQAAIASFGLALMQPQWGGFGQNLAQAVGAAGTSARMQEEERQKDVEAQSKQDLRAQQAELAGARAETQGARADASSLNAAVRQQGIEAANQRGRLARILQLHRDFAREQESTKKENANNALVNPKAPIKPIPSWDDFLRARPGISRELGIGPEQTGEGAAVDEATQAPGAPAAAARPRRVQGGNTFEQQPDGSWTFVPPGR